MEALTNTVFLGNPLMEWAQALGFFVGSIVVARIVYSLFKGMFKRIASKTATKWDDILVDQVEEPVALGIVILGFGWGTRICTLATTWISSWSTCSKS